VICIALEWGQPGRGVLITRAWHGDAGFLATWGVIDAEIQIGRRVVVGARKAAADG
jgi:hypothetical protein